MAPIVAMLVKSGLSILASAVATKGKDLIQEKLGIDIEDAIGSEEGRLKLRALEFEHQQFLITSAQASEVRDLEWFKQEVEDKKSARQRDAAEGTNWRAHVMFIIAIGVVVLLVVLVWRTPELPEFTKGVVTLLIGRFTGYLDNIYNFEFGTTRSSKTKDTTIEALSRKE